jgi:hypothetical protein
MSRYYLWGGECEEEKSHENLGELNIKERWPAIAAWLKANPKKRWTMRGVICELDGIDASNEPWSIAALNSSQ